MVRNCLQLAEVLAVHGSENEVAFFLGVTDVTEGGTEAREALDWEYASLWEHTYRLIVGALSHDWLMRFRLHQVENLAVTVEEHQARLHHVLKDEVLVIVTGFIDVAHDEVVEGCLPSGGQVIRLRVVVDLFLSDFGVEDFFVHASAEVRGNAALCILNEERLVVFGEEAFADQDALVDKLLFLVHSDLPHLHIKLYEPVSDLLDRVCLELDLDGAPGQVLVVGNVNGADFADVVEEGLPVVDAVGRYKVPHGVTVANLADAHFFRCCRVLRRRRLSLARGHRDTIVVFAGCIVVIFFFLGRGFLRRGLLFFLESHDGFATVADVV